MRGVPVSNADAKKRKLTPRAPRSGARGVRGGASELELYDCSDLDFCSCAILGSKIGIGHSNMDERKASCLMSYFIAPNGGPSDG